MKAYLRKLRQSAGHMPILVCGASVIVENAQGDILLHLRSDNHCWAYPGGTVDIDEEVEAAARRELLEETGIQAGALKLFGVFSGRDMRHVYPNGDEISNVDIVYLCRDYTGEAVPDYVESSEVRFFSWQHLPENISPPCVRALRQYAAMRKDEAF